MTMFVGGTGTPWLRRYRPVVRPRLRLVCLPHAGGTPALFRDWPRQLPGDVDVLAVCYPGRQDRVAEPCPDSMAELAEGVAGAVEPLLDLPVVLFGHSMGALVAYEVAARLEQGLGRAPAHLVLSAHAPPDRMPPRPPWEEGDAALLAAVRRIGGVPQEILDNPALRALVLPAVRADYHLLGAYRPAVLPTTSAPVTVLRGADDPMTSEADAAAWARLTTGGFTLRTFPGDHFYLVPGERDVLIAVRDLLARVPV
ncbi:thioesterase II family protein [Streptoalloteichus hindustanus]|uniref:Pyochelin biosynthetic protein PchC n=1 Tax=Streptoalloteichus hindustanus TaxID=2017 RepID=A0A1M5P3B7_STRHI|nr:alpha/beta fold hydrolase [Streptoalloteichus hindustanus]SHG96215.1 pyochelin biosynthetic protein PchC [Streptoalloteichus hindustanus]